MFRKLTHTQSAIAQPSVAQPDKAQPSIAQSAIAQPPVAQPSITLPSIARPALAIGVLCMLLIMFLRVSPAVAQTYSFRTYDEFSGLPGNYLNVIEQDRDGMLWVGIDNGLFRYDGFTFHHISFNDTLPRGSVTALFSDSAGTMWVGMSDGSLFTWQSGSTLERQLLDGADKINRIIENDDSAIWVVTQTGGIFIAEAGASGRFTRVVMPEGMNLFDIAFTGDGRFLAATQDNLHLCSVSGGRGVSEALFPEMEYTWVQTLLQLDDKVWFAGTGDNGLFMIRRDGDIITAGAVSGAPFHGANIPSLAAMPGKTLAVATRSAGAVKVTFSDNYHTVNISDIYNSRTGLPDNNVRTLFCDREGNLWIGLFNKGLAAVTTNAFSFSEPPTDKEIIFIGMAGESAVAGTRNGLWSFDPQSGSFTGFRRLTPATGGSPISSWATDEDGNVWIGTLGNGLWLMRPDGGVHHFFASANPGQNRINSIATDGERVWLGTGDGVLLLDRESGEQRAVYTTLDLLPHNFVSQVVVNRPGEVMVATRSDQLCYIHITGGVRSEGPIMEGVRMNEVRTISVVPGEAVIAGTDGNGLFLFAGDTLLNYTEYDGLLTNFCYSTLIASDGRVWSGHQKGFSITNPATGSVRTFSTAFGVKGDCMPNAITELPDGRICIGTTDGVVIYNPALEPEVTAAPQAGIISVVINNRVYPYRDSYSLPYRRSYSIRVNYAGILLSDPLNVLYRYRLEGFNGGWSDYTSDRSVSYNLRDGSYRFTVEAQSFDNPDSATSASFTLQIQKPVTERWWFILSILAVLAAVVYLVVLLRERAHRRQREFLESELQKRTAEVYEQKEELAQKNLDITESITYAKRIQSSVLPDITRLNKVFSDAFVFFRPRDIVSGDFYWYDWVDKDRFIVVCSDSTGHGVPGAFMSMIGTALLQDIITVKKITRPSQVLHELDKQIFTTLNQNQELEASNDGMDIVVCDFNLATRQLVFASAMRPVILIIDGVQHYVRGNRSSVGGESVREKFFDDQEYHLREGDMVYLFTDGYCDQFGGEHGKKMKISRLRTLLDEIHMMNESEQYRSISTFFDEWMGDDNDQVDDVLFMGIRV